jgi:hypothetical protein
MRMVEAAMRSALVVTAAVLPIALVACRGDRSSPSDRTSSPTAAVLTDLSPSLDEMRSEFNAHKHEARFLTLLSPT